ncbi:Trimeric GatFAB AmidoTransferase(AdT) complex subunit [Dipsacomyces acuminosporus]|nr:Trimeric GatFAB AmidoTransferase(AdT) complex subunit [Dipsacomyces acuminosporus]
MCFLLNSARRLRCSALLPRRQYPSGLACACRLHSGQATITVQSAVETIAKRNTALNAFVSAQGPAEAETPKAPDGPLRGWPVGVKANIATGASVTSCGSRALENYISPFKATAVEALERAGAVVVGKTNMDEFGMGSKNKFSVYGPARNPRLPGPGDSTEEPDLALYHTPGGSSGGSAAAVAAGMCRAALGSDTGGSIRLPAAWCGVVGFKPTYGRISRYGLVSYASSLDTIGIIARDVQDVQAVYRAISAPDHQDMTCMTDPLRTKIESLTSLRPWIKRPFERSCDDGSSKPLAGVRVGVPKECWVEELSAAALESWRSGADKLASLGAELIGVSLPHIPHSLPAYYTLALAEASSNLARYDGIRYGTRSRIRPNTKDLQNASQKYANTRDEGLGREVQRRILLGTYVMTSSACEHYYVPSQKIRRIIQQEFDSVFALPNALHAAAAATMSTSRPQRAVDAILFPTATDTAPLLSDVEASQVSSYVNDVMTVPANLAGIPAITVPAGLHKGMPVGLQLAAQYGDDELLLHIASYL